MTYILLITYMALSSSPNNGGVPSWPVAYGGTYQQKQYCDLAAIKAQESLGATKAICVEAGITPPTVVVK